MFFTDPKTKKTYSFTHCLLTGWGKEGNFLTLFKKNGDMEVVSADSKQAKAAVDAARRAHRLFIDNGCSVSDIAYICGLAKFQEGK